MRNLLPAALLLALTGRAGADEPSGPLGHHKSAWENPGFPRAAAMRMGDEYRNLIGAQKTEREFVRAALAMTRNQGYRDLFAERSTGARGRLTPGTRFFAVVHDKLAAIGVIGSLPIAEGVHLVATHVDAVRIDLKQRPLYADGNLALLETHYYGGIKPYQWLSVPLELRGLVVKKDGTPVEVSVGSKPGDPVLVIPDEAVHVSWMVDREEGEEVPGEKLDPIVSSTPAARPPAGADPYAAEAARLLADRYGISVDDLTSAELELVPAAPARDVGIDRALVGGYGQDDRACSYAALRAVLDLGTPRHTAIVMLTDKEEIGSTGNTGARSSFVRRVLAELIEATGGSSTEAVMNRAFGASMVWSADVTGAANPHYREVYERKNASFIGSGVVWDQSGVHAEVLGYVRTLLDKNGITHQPSTWTKATGSKSEDGTVLPYFTDQGMNGLDVSIPLLSMHSAFELVSKADLYEGYRAYRAFLAD
jgi:aspartyl aminopeptidase